MDKQFYSPVTEIVSKTLKDKGFEPKNDSGLEYYSDGNRAFCIDYDNDKSLLQLKFAVLKEGEGVDFKTVSSWLLDENSTDKDMASIGNDFSDAVLEMLGMKATAKGINKVDMPSKNKKAETVTVDIFTARFLAVYPNYKSEYVNNVSEYGEFMYDKFYSEFGPVVVKDVLTNGNSKAADKLFNLLNSCYVIGDVATETTIVYCILAPALLDDERLRKDAYTYMEKYPFLKTATESMIKLLSSASKRKKYMGE